MIKICQKCKYLSPLNTEGVCIKGRSVYWSCNMFFEDGCPKFEEVNDNKDIPIKNEPPLGVIPSCLYYENRIKELKNAIKRYLDSDTEVNQEWIIEYNTIVNMLKHIGEYKNGK